MNLFSPLSASYNPSVAPTKPRKRHQLSVILFASLFVFCSSAHAQQPATEAPKAPATPAEPQTPAQIDLLETKVRFESNGDSRKEVHCIVKINSELGVRQFARLNFDYNRSFEKIEIPLVRVTHSNGGIADVLPSAITDNPNPAVVNAPAYQDVRVKSVRILGLAPSDTLEYRVITAVTNHPLAPDFWLDHTFDRTGIVSHEIFELDLPASRPVQIHFNAAIPGRSTQKTGEGRDERNIFRWNLVSKLESKDQKTESDLAITTFLSWDALAEKLEHNLRPSIDAGVATRKKASELADSLASNEEKVSALYDFVSQKIASVDLQLGATGFQVGLSDKILASRQATTEDKFFLFYSLAGIFKMGSLAAMTGSTKQLSDRLPRPSLLSHLLIIASVPPPPASACSDCDDYVWLDPSLEVAPFAALPASLRGKQALADKKGLFFAGGAFLDVPGVLPFPSTQRVTIDARLGAEGALSAKVKYTLRGDNELLLRVAFHQSPREKWNEVAQLLALSDGFRGKIENVSASDPYATKDPFTVEYEISQPKFVDWSKKPVRIPAILPLVGLPDPPAKATAPIELGTPLDVTTTVTLHLPPDTTVESPAGTAVDRDYAKFSSTYAATGNTLTAARHIQFVLRQLPANRALDYNTFLHAVQNDQSQRFTLFRPDPTPAPANPAKPH
jgi:hypothetical protein